MTEKIKCSKCGREIGQIEETAHYESDDPYVGVNFYCWACWMKEER